MKNPSRWSELEPEPAIVEAIDHAGSRPEDAAQDEKRGWSSKFANGCAMAFADAFGGHAELRDKKRILPSRAEGRTEPLTPLGRRTTKRIDVTVSDRLLGLEIGVSLKGLNSKDAKSGRYDKNLTGRLYELGDEVRLVHEHLPRAFMVGVFFLPLEATVDKQKAPSAFASTVLKLRSRTRRVDSPAAAQTSLCDAGYVGLYSAASEQFPKGVVRFINVEKAPPRRGRPVISDTLSLQDVVKEIIEKATFAGDVAFAEAEGE